ncbi:MAG: hypothetical protein ACE5FY_04305, partial [Nitrospiria bacterium]
GPISYLFRGYLRDRGKGRRLAVFTLAVASVIWFSKAFDVAMKVGGQILPVIKLEFPETMIRLGVDEQNNFWRFGSTDRNEFLLALDGPLPLYLEPLLMVLAVCLLLIFLSTRIWEEVEI